MARVRGAIAGVVRDPRLRAAVATFVFWAGFFALARAAFLGYHRAAAASVPWSVLLATFRHGLRLDLAGAAYLTAVPIVLLLLSVIRPLTGIARALIAGFLVTTVVILSAGVALDLELYRHFDRRLDAGFLSYLATPREAWISTGGSPRLLLAIIAVGLAAVALSALRLMVWPSLRRLGPGRLGHVVLLTGLLGVLVIPARGGVQVIPVTASSAYFSRYQFANAAALNAWWVFFDSLSRGLDDRHNPYLVTTPERAAALVQAALAPVGPSVRPIATARPNVVFVVWESLSARTVGSLAAPVQATPHLDALAAEGILFRRFYAAGNRTDKGIAAILSGYPGLPAGSLLMVPARSRSVPGLSTDLHEAGYHTAFVYGGELEFGSMQAYLIGHDYDRIVGRDDFAHSTLTSKWGAPDSVAAVRFLEEMDRMPEPFFGVWLTLSSHEPFDIPGVTTPAGADWQTRYLASLGYTDEVVGRTVAEMRKRDWWERTLLVIVADHGRRLIPLDAGAPPQDADALYRIPMLWLGGALTARDSTVDGIGSQLDIAPTIRDLLGLDRTGDYPWGRSLLRPVADPFAYYGFEGGFGLVTRRGAMTYFHGRDAGSGAALDPRDRELGRALLQLSYQDFLDR